MRIRIIKPVLILLFLFSVSIHTYAQLGSFIKSIDEFDLIIGPSLVSVRDDWWSKYAHEKVQIGYALGIGVKYKLSHGISLGGEILYERKGFMQEFHSNYIDELGMEKTGLVQFTFNFNYITIPIHFRYSLKQGKSKFFVEGGPYIGYLLREQTISNYITRNITQISDETEQYNNLDLGASLSIGYKIPLSNKHKINFRITDRIGTIPINKWEGNKIYTNSLYFLVGLTFLK